MAYVKVPAPSVVYHLAKADRLDSILDDGQIRRFEDSECWFCESLPKMKAYMEQTVMCEGKPYKHNFSCHLPSRRCRCCDWMEKRAFYTKGEKVPMKWHIAPQQ